MANVILIEATPTDANGNVVVVRMAGGGSRGYDHKGSTDWLAGVATRPLRQAKIGFDESGWTGRSTPSITTMTYSASSRSRISRVGKLYWNAARIIVSEGDDASPAPLFTPMIVGTVTSFAVEGADAQIAIADLSAQLDVPAVPGTFAGTGDLEGDDSAAGRVKRLTVGRAFDVEGRVLLAAYNIYEFGDPAKINGGFTDVRDKGRSGVAPVIVAWQGDALSTLNALKASSPPQGGGAYAPSIGCVKWWTQPAGPLCADITNGNLSLGNVTRALIGRTPTDILIPQAEVDAANATRPGDLGVHVDDANENVSGVLDRLHLGASSLWTVDPAGTLRLRPWSFDAPVLALPCQRIKRTALLPPLLSRKLGFQRNYRIHGSGELAADVSSSDVYYENGTPIEVLKPQEAGANITEARIAAAIAGQGAGATAAANLVLNQYVPVGENQVVLSGFAQGLAGFSPSAGLSNWYPLARADVPTDTANKCYVDLYLDAISSGYTGKRHVVQVHLTQFSNTGNSVMSPNLYIDVFHTVSPWGGVGPGTAFAQARPYMMSVKQGDRTFARCLGAEHRCSLQLYALFFDSNGTLVEAVCWGTDRSPYGYAFPTYVTSARDGGGENGDPANFNVMGGYYDVQNPNSAYMSLMWRVLGTGGGDPYVFFTEPGMGKLAPGQTVLPPYADGPSDPRADITSANTAAAFIGQRALATRDSVDLNSGDVLNRYAWALAYGNGQNVDSLRPGEAGSNVTENRVSAAFNGQRALATKDVVDFSSGDVANRFADFLFYGNTGMSVQYLKPAEPGANITESRVAAAFYGQRALATRDSVDLNSGDVLNRYAWAIAYGNGQNVDSLRPGEANANTTETRVASAISGQGALATLSQADTTQLAANAASDMLYYSNTNSYRGSGAPGTGTATGGSGGSVSPGSRPGGGGQIP